MALRLVPSPNVPETDSSVPSEAEAREQRFRRRAWLASALLHGVILALLLGLWRSPHIPEPEPIVVALVPGVGSVGTAGGSGGGATEAGPTAQGSLTKSPTPAADTAPPEAPLTATTAAQPVPPSPETQTTETPPAPPTPPPKPTVESTVAPTPTKPLEALPPPPPRKPTPPQPTAVAAAPPPALPAKPTPQPSPSPAPLSQVATAPVPQSTPGTPGTGSGRGGPGGVGQGASGAGLGIVGMGNGPGDDYLDRVQRWISKYKTYPEAAKKQKQQGGPLLAILLRRDGTVLDVRIDKSSGFPLLDEAALKAVRDASPVPPFPASYPQDQAPIELPFDFHLGFFDRVFD
jgi:periplasmic protein TonB